MPAPHKNKFAQSVRHKLVDADCTVKDLAAQIGRPRETVSRAIHSTKFPRVRRLIATALNIAIP
jgi:lambda repressor-like predicted transcriptional regulator